MLIVYGSLSDRELIGTNATVMLGAVLVGCCCISQDMHPYMTVSVCCLAEHSCVVLLVIRRVCMVRTAVCSSTRQPVECLALLLTASICTGLPTKSGVWTPSAAAAAAVTDVLYQDNPEANPGWAIPCALWRDCVSQLVRHHELQQQLAAARRGEGPVDLVGAIAQRACPPPCNVHSCLLLILHPSLFPQQA